MRVFLLVGKLEALQALSSSGLGMLGALSSPGLRSTLQGLCLELTVRHRVSGGREGHLTGLPLALAKGTFLALQKDATAEPRVGCYF